MISLPVKNLAKSLAFYEAIGFSRNKQFVDDNFAWMMLSDAISVVLLTHQKWKEFTTRTIPDAKTSAQVALMLSRESRAAVDAMIEKGAEAGGVADPNPVENFEGMYGRSVEDPDGHIWEAKWMDMSAMMAQN